MEEEREGILSESNGNYAYYRLGLNQVYQPLATIAN